MDQKKIGSFIAAKRKACGLTQAELAEKLFLTDRAVSKWETGRALPDVSVMPQLCQILGVTVNDLFSGKELSMENYNEEMEKNLMDIAEEKRRADKNLLTVEILLGGFTVLFLLIGAVLAAYLPLPEWQRVLIVVGGMIPLLISFPFLIRIEQTAGYYECQNCKHRYVPDFKAVTMAPHMGRTRYMKCPVCDQKTWQKKVLTRKTDEKETEK